MQNKSLLSRGIALVVIALFVLVSTLPIVAGCPGQNDYWVVTNGVIDKAMQNHTIDMGSYPGYGTITETTSIVWYTDYYGIDEPIARGGMKDWHIQTTIDIVTSGSLSAPTATIRIYHASNIYPETITVSVIGGVATGVIWTITAGGQTTTVVNTGGSAILNLGPVNSFTLTMVYG